MSEVRVDQATTSGTFSLDGETHEVDNNVWVVGDDSECVVIDAPHDVDAAVRAGVIALGTLTGIFTEDDLRRRCGPDHPDVVVLPNLEDTAGVLRAMRL